MVNIFDDSMEMSVDHNRQKRGDKVKLWKEHYSAWVPALLNPWSFSLSSDFVQEPV